MTMPANDRRNVLRTAGALLGAAGASVSFSSQAQTPAIGTKPGANTFLGDGALEANVHGKYNTAVGTNALKRNEGVDPASQDNSAFGLAALQNNTTGHANTAVGSNALFSNSDGSYNVAVGVDTLRSLVGGNHNIAFGYDALHYNVPGSFNIAAGYNALRINDEGCFNTAIGIEAMVCHTKCIPLIKQNGSHKTEEACVPSGNRPDGGDANVAIGFRSGTRGQKQSDGKPRPWVDIEHPCNSMTQTWGKENVWLGCYAGPSEEHVDNSIAIGYGATAKSNEVSIGNRRTSTTILHGNVTIINDGKAISITELFEELARLRGDLAAVRNELGKQSKS